VGPLGALRQKAQPLRAYQVTVTVNSVSLRQPPMSAGRRVFTAEQAVDFQTWTAEHIALVVGLPLPLPYACRIVLVAVGTLVGSVALRPNTPLTATVIATFVIVGMTMVIDAAYALGWIPASIVCCPSAAVPGDSGWRGQTVGAGPLWCVPVGG